MSPLDVVSRLERLVSPTPIDAATETSVLFELIAQRYERKSIALTANTPFSQWGEVFVDAS